jgi:hypothetical protein
MNYPALSDKDITRLTNGNVNIIVYEDLHKFKDIDELWGCTKACIILICYEPNKGHWVTVFIGGDGKLHFFNSYGDMGSKYEGYPDGYLPLINKEYRRESYQDYPYLSELMLNSPYELEYNNHQFQSLNPKIRTCGYWCVLRLYCQNMTDDEFIKFIKKCCSENNISPDDLVVLTV